MLKRQFQEIEHYPENIKVIVVDDCSKEEIKEWPERVDVYRILDDIPWNRGGARNLGTLQAKTDWIVHIDIDHILPVESAIFLSNFMPDKDCWYRFPRFRVGPADETRRKDKIPDDCTFGKIHPHIDSYLVTKDNYWKAGGYDESYSGCLGGGSPFLEQLGKVAKLELLPDAISLHVHTRHSTKDANTEDLSRDTSEYRRRRELIGHCRGENPIRFDWVQL